METRNVSQIGKTVSNYNFANKAKASTEKNKNGIDSFNTVEFTSKKDGKTYLAKKLTLKENGKELTGIYVFDKAAKPDKNGNIQGEFMNYETFMEKLSDELPSVPANSIKAYNPNITTKSPEEKFDLQFNSGVRLSDDKVLIRPHILNTGSTEIKPSKNPGEYNVIFTSYVGGYKHEPKVRTLDEESLLKNKGLSSGTIKRLGDDTYEVTYYTDRRFNDNYETATEVMSKEECTKFLRENGWYI